MEEGKSYRSGINWKHAKSAIEKVTWNEFLMLWTNERVISFREEGKSYLSRINWKHAKGAIVHRYKVHGQDNS